jgi:RNA polymerase sigma factor (sigma-70 family)
VHQTLSYTGALIAACRKGEVRAQRRVYEMYHSTLMNICMRYSKDRGEAELLVHDSFLKIFGRIDSFKDDGSFEGWMKRICVNTCLDNFKRRNTFAGAASQATVYADDPSIFDQHFVSNDVVAKLSLNAILQLVERLPEKERIVFKLHAVDGFEHTEISKALGIKPNHCYWLLHSARKQLQTLLKSASK